MAPEIDAAQDLRRAVLVDVLHSFYESRGYAFPLIKAFRISHEGARHVIDDLLQSRHLRTESDTYVLNLTGLAECGTEGEQEINTCNRLLPTLKDWWRQEQSKPVSISTLAKMAQMRDQEVAKALTFMAELSIFTGRNVGTSGIVQSIMLAEKVLDSESIDPTTGLNVAPSRPGAASRPEPVVEAQSTAPAANAAQSIPAQTSAPSEDTSVRPVALCDRPAPVDALGFTPYVSALRQFLADPETKPPLTLSVEGEWGAGKSSFLKLLGNSLREQGYKVIEFNAWRHEKDESLWSAFAEQLYSELLPTKTREKMLALLSIYWSRLDKTGAMIELAAILVPVLVFVFSTALSAAQLLALARQTQSLPDTPFVTEIKLAVTLVSAAASGGVAKASLTHARHAVAALFKADFRKHFNIVDYKSKRSLLSRIQEDLTRFLDVYAGRDRVFVFIDDLDRCEVPRAADLLQALSVIVPDDSKLIVVLGIDREKVAAGVAIRHEKLLPLVAPSALRAYDPRKAMEFGYAFLERFIQLPFRLPQAGRFEFDQYLSKLLGEAPATSAVSSAHGGSPGAAFLDAYLDTQEPPLDAEAQSERSAPRDLEPMEPAKLESAAFRGVLRMVAPALDYNPRRIIQFLNVFRLQVYIARATRLFDRESVGYEPLTLHRLGKLVAIGLQWPSLLPRVLQGETSFSQLEFAAIGDTARSNDVATEIIRIYPKLKAFLLVGLGLLRPGSSDLASIHKNRFSIGGVDPSVVLRTSARPGKPPSVISAR